MQQHQSISSCTFPSLLSVVLAALLCPSLAQADSLSLHDGSSLQGEVVRMDAEVVVFRTAFAGELRIERKNIAGLTTDSKVITALEDGSRLVGKLRYDEQRGQALDTELVGSVAVPANHIASVWQPTAPSPEMLAMEQARVVHEQEVQKLKSLQKEPHELWSGELQFGLSGSSGNTDKEAHNGKMVARRTTDFDRLELSLEGRTASDQGAQTEAEVLAVGSLERDFTDRWFTFGQASFERDRFEDVDLRTTLSSGVGYFLIKEPDHQWKPRIGLGYQFEAVKTGPNEGEFVLTLGYDYWIRAFGKTRFGHKFNYLPTFSAPGTDYRIESEFSVRHPLSDDQRWDIGFSLRHNYDALPNLGVKALDTHYKLNLGYSFE